MSFFHKVKKAVVGKKEEAGGVSLCPEYDAVRGDFESLHEVMLRIRQHLLTYREANSRLWTSATSLSTEFANMLEPAASVEDHPYTSMAATLKSSHASLPTERERLDTMLNACLFPLKEQLGKYEELKVRMADHDKQKDEVVYYNGKVSGLRTAREQSKKAESAADKEKYERNVKKMQEQEAAFFSMDQVLTAELRYAFEHRVAVLGPIMLAFVLAEKQMANSYTAAINGVKLVDVTEANAWLAKHEAAMAAKGVTVQTITQHKTIVTNLESPTNPVVTVSTHERKASTAANVPSAVNPDVVVTNLSTSGVVVSEPQFASGATRTSASQLQSPTGQSSSSFFDAFDADFANSSATFESATNSSAASHSAAATTSTPFSDPFATTPKSSVTSELGETYSNGAVDEVPYTIGSASSAYASSVSSTHPHPAPIVAPASTVVPDTLTSTHRALANGTASTFPVEASLADSAPVSGVTTPAVIGDDLALEKTRGAHQLDAAHGEAGLLGNGAAVAGHDMDAANNVDKSHALGVGEKTDMYGTHTATTTHTTTATPATPFDD